MDMGPCLFFCLAGLANGNCLRHLHGGVAQTPLTGGVEWVKSGVTCTDTQRTRPMIQDRLTAKFRSAKVSKPVAETAKPATKVKPAKDPVWEAYTRSRKAAGSLFWL